MRSRTYALMAVAFVCSGAITCNAKRVGMLTLKGGLIGRRQRSFDGFREGSEVLRAHHFLENSESAPPRRS